MKIIEFRVTLPMTVEEYQVAQLWSVAEASKNETGGGEGIEVIKNEPFHSFDPACEAFPGDKPVKPLLNDPRVPPTGQYTYKIYHLQSKVPGFIRMLAPSGALDITEKAWNAYPYCRTEVTNPEYMKDNFIIRIESMHIADTGEQHNVHNLSPDELAKREVIHIDIGMDPVARGDYKPEWDPKLYKSQKTGRGPLSEAGWKNKVQPVMTAYKLVTCQFKWFGLQTKVENFIMKTERRIFTNFHRQVFCWTDNWYGLTMEDIRRIEDKTKDELDQQIKEGKVRGTKGED